MLNKRGCASGMGPAAGEIGVTQSRERRGQPGHEKGQRGGPARPRLHGAQGHVHPRADNDAHPVEGKRPEPEHPLERLGR
jgi:hypothetical protein